jgi:hypothetical protein
VKFTVVELETPAVLWAAVAQAGLLPATADRGEAALAEPAATMTTAARPASIAAAE